MTSKIQRAFVSQGRWEAPLVTGHDAGSHKRATLRVSALIATGVLVAAMLPGLELNQSKAVSVSHTRTTPEIVQIIPKQDERILAENASLFGDITASATLRHARIPTTDIGGVMRGQLVLASPEAVQEAEALEPHTLRLDGRILRLSGIEAPRTDEMCRRLDGMLVSCIDRALSYMDLLIKGRRLKCEEVPVSSHNQGGNNQDGNNLDGPAQGICRAGEADLAEAMVRQGWARASGQPARIPPEERFVLAQAAARKQKLGIWQ